MFPAVGTERAEGFVARLGRRAGEPPPTRVTGSRVHGCDGELNMTCRFTLSSAPFEGGSDAATRWHSTGGGLASVAEPSYGSVARPVGGRASSCPWRARVLLDRRCAAAVRPDVPAAAQVM